MLLVLDGEVQQGVEVPLTLGGAEFVGPPGRDDAPDVGFVQNPGDGLHRGAQRALGAHLVQTPDDGMIVLSPGHGVVAVR